MSSSEKSFPFSSKFKSVIQILAVVLLPEFQTVQNSSHRQTVFETIWVPTGLPLIVNCKFAKEGPALF